MRERKLGFPWIVYVLAFDEFSFENKLEYYVGGEVEMSEDEKKHVENLFDAILCTVAECDPEYRRRLERYGLFGLNFAKNREGWFMNITVLDSRNKWSIVLRENEPVEKTRFIIIVLSKETYSREYVRNLVRKLAMLLDAGRILDDLGINSSVKIREREILELTLSHLKTKAMNTH